MEHTILGSRTVRERYGRSRWPQLLLPEINIFIFLVIKRIRDLFNTCDVRVQWQVEIQ